MAIFNSVDLGRGRESGVFICERCFTMRRVGSVIIGCIRELGNINLGVSRDRLYEGQSG